MIDLHKLRHAVILARTGNFSRAAAVLNLTQPALTRSIQSLEEQHAIRLFDRGRSGASLTRAGAMFIREAEHLLQNAETLERTAAQLGTGELGEVSFGMGPLPASLLLPSLLREVAVAHKGLRVRADVQEAEELSRQLQEGRIEFFCAAGPVVAASASVDTTPIAKIPLALLMRKRHPLAGRAALKVEDLRAYPVVGGAARYVTSGYAPTIACENFHILKDVTAKSDAIWYSTPLILTPSEQRRAFAIVRAPTIMPESVNLVLVNPARRAFSPAADVILTRVRAILSDLAVAV